MNYGQANFDRIAIDMYDIVSHVCFTPYSENTSVFITNNKYINTIKLQFIVMIFYKNGIFLTIFLVNECNNVSIYIFKLLVTEFTSILFVSAKLE